MTATTGSIRLTFRSSGGRLALVSEEHLPMRCPPPVGEPPEIGRHSGYWVELRDAPGTVLFHRVLHDPLRLSVEVPGRRSPHRRFGGIAEAPDVLFEALVPDHPDARTAVLVGDPPDPSTGTAPPRSRELARFDLGGGEATRANGEGEAP